MRPLELIVEAYSQHGNTVYSATLVDDRGSQGYQIRSVDSFGWLKEKMGEIIARAAKDTKINSRAMILVPDFSGPSESEMADLQELVNMYNNGWAKRRGPSGR